MRTICHFLLISVITACMSCAHNKIIPLETNQITEAIHVGAPALPYLVYSKISLQRLDQAFKTADAAVTIEDTYRAVYNFSFDDIPADGNTGQVFTNMETASRYLQKLLKFKGANDSNKYLMTSIDTANKDGYILIATIYRPSETISVFNKFNFLARETLTPENPSYYLAYRIDVDQNPLDIVYEWAALPIECVSYQAYQAVLLTLTANKILAQKVRNDYWREERQWIAGNYLSVMIKQDIIVSQALGIEKGFAERRKIYNDQFRNQ